MKGRQWEHVWEGCREWRKGGGTWQEAFEWILGEKGEEERWMREVEEERRWMKKEENEEIEREEEGGDVGGESVRVKDERERERFEGDRA